MTIETILSIATLSMNVAKTCESTGNFIDIVKNSQVNKELNDHRRNTEEQYTRKAKAETKRAEAETKFWESAGDSLSKLKKELEELDKKILETKDENELAKLQWLYNQKNMSIMSTLTGAAAGSASGPSPVQVQEQEQEEDSAETESNKEK
jgi:phage shock protein A